MNTWYELKGMCSTSGQNRQKYRLKECVFVNLALKIPCHIVKSAILSKIHLQTFSAFLPTGMLHGVEGRKRICDFFCSYIGFIKIPVNFHCSDACLGYHFLIVRYGVKSVMNESSLKHWNECMKHSRKRDLK